MIKTKDAVLAYLKRCDDYVSGESLGESLQISRTAINAAVKALRADGYAISSSTNKGYKLSASPDTITNGELLTLLPRERVEQIDCLLETDSTNNRVRELAVAGAPAGQVVIAESQTAGRGRYGRSFVSPQGKGVYLSILLRPRLVPHVAASTLTAWVAVAIANAVEKACGVRPQIKWVNDLVLGNKKICGILTETTVESETGHIQYIVVGAGVNVNESPRDFPDEVREIATSLYTETGRKFDRARLAAQIIAELDTLAADWPDAKERYLAAYRRDCITVGKSVRLSDGRIGYAQSIDDDFGLVVRFDDGTTQSVSYGEVSVRGLYGYV